MRLEQDSQTQLMKQGRRSHTFSQSDKTLKVLLDTDVKKFQKLISETKICFSETTPSLAKFYKSFVISCVDSSRAIIKKPTSLSSFTIKGGI
jgi:hypothetical protein